MNEATKEALYTAWDYCDKEDKSTEFMLAYMADVAEVSHDAVMEFIQQYGGVERGEWYQKKTEEMKPYFVKRTKDTATVILNKDYEEAIHLIRSGFKNTDDTSIWMWFMEHPHMLHEGTTEIKFATEEAIKERFRVDLSEKVVDKDDIIKDIEGRVEVLSTNKLLKAEKENELNFHHNVLKLLKD